MVKTVLSKIFPNSKLFSTEQAIRVIPWFKDNGDKTHRLNYDLNENSFVLDLGGYEGQWASDIFGKYCCNIYIFEPYLKYFNEIETRFKKNLKIKVYPFGLSRDTAIKTLSISADRSSAFKSGANIVAIRLVNASEFIGKNIIDKIALIKINIEGGEYDLLEHLIETNMISNIENIQVQFHDFVPEAEKRMKNIQDKLKKTHLLTYQYEFVWENWKLMLK